MTGRQNRLLWKIPATLHSAHHPLVTLTSQTAMLPVQNSIPIHPRGSWLTLVNIWLAWGNSYKRPALCLKVGQLSGVPGHPMGSGWSSVPLGLHHCPSLSCFRHSPSPENILTIDHKHLIPVSRFASREPDPSSIQTLLLHKLVTVVLLHLFLWLFGWFLPPNWSANSCAHRCFLSTKHSNHIHWMT